MCLCLSLCFNVFFFFRKDLYVLCQLHDLRMKFDWLLDSDLLREVQRATESLGEVRSKHVVNVAADAVPWVSAKAAQKKRKKKEGRNSFFLSELIMSHPGLLQEFQPILTVICPKKSA